MNPRAVRPATTYPALVGRVLKELRERHGLDQTHLAAAVGVTQPTWSRIERGDIPVGVEQLALAGHALGVSPGQLLSLADVAANNARAQGIEVRLNRTRDDGGIVLIGAAAVALLVLGALAKK
ncbi:MAG: helix-turn-helix transcriptional regulator [Deltaproteobacteria bacterium]|nr:helix-turn-helix transcriptional regulator [Deltaproteobacteria bacterium]